MEVQTELLKSQTTESLKALLDYSREQKQYYVNSITDDEVIFQGDKYNVAYKIYSTYSEIVRTLEDELGKRLEDIFIF